MNERADELTEGEKPKVSHKYALLLINLDPCDEASRLHATAAIDDFYVFLHWNTK
jgi:hypothetical protein